jgi:hypothetical protein
MNILRLYYRYKWYSQASSSLQKDLPSFNSETTHEKALTNYNQWLQYYAYICAEQKGRIQFRDQHIPVEKQDAGHEHQIKRCTIGIKLALSQLTKWATYITSITDTVMTLATKQDEEHLQESICMKQQQQSSSLSHTKKTNRKKRHVSAMASHVVPAVPSEDIETVIAEIQKSAEESEIQACMDVAALILELHPGFSARDEKVPIIDLKVLDLVITCNKNKIDTRKCGIRSYV